TYLRMVYEMKPAGKWMCQAERKAIMAHLGENIIADCVRRGQHDDALRLRRQKDSGENAA
ncbi:MAG TPA: hypothetical protein VIU12_02940, partial [Chryseolinea sp.]